MNPITKKCPICRSSVEGSIYRVRGTYVYSIICGCGLSYTIDGFDTPEEAERTAIIRWNSQQEHDYAEVSWLGTLCGVCSCGGFITFGEEFCSKCGGKLVNPKYPVKARVSKFINKKLRKRNHE